MPSPSCLALLQALSKTIGLDLAFDERRHCMLMLDEDILISIRSLDDDTLGLYGLLSEFPQPLPAEDLMQLLSMNFLLMERCGMSIGLDRATDAVLLLERLPVAMVSADDIGDRVAQFAEQVRKLIDWLGARDEPRQSAEGRAEPETSFMPAFGQIV
ncbi:CesT family type III secretion system chaperone [Achromobacter sp. RTa]|uniref:CesT family type III secretion system chaperone n=1 Tax=Achromobacter sp. RTa TaxID=1532557 RepID=UPI0009DCCE6A|nr:CesT family type III secretion system chaperone [Achromobacter sp. RTa]